MAIAEEPLSLEASLLLVQASSNGAHYVIDFFQIGMTTPLLNNGIPQLWGGRGQSQKNPVSAPAMLTGKFFRIRKVFAIAAHY